MNTPPTSRLAAVPLTEAQMLDAFEAIEPADAAALRAHAEGGHVDTLTLIGARHCWRAFQRAVRSVEQAHGIGVQASHSGPT